MKRCALLLLILLFAFTSCENAKPVPRDKRLFIGSWISRSGFQLHIDSPGIARVIPVADAANPDYKKLDVGITPEYAERMFIGFEGDSLLTLTRPRLIFKAFRIDSMPYRDGDTTKMILNGVILVRQK